VQAANIQIFLNTSVTSRILSTANNNTATEALLMVDEPAPGIELLCGSPTAPFTNVNNTSCTILGTGTGAGTYSGAAGRPNVFQGYLAASNSIVFLGVPVDPPGSTGSLIVRITNIRANTNALGVAGANSSPTPLIETITASGSSSVPINNPSQTIGLVQKGLIASSTLIGAFQQCISQNIPSSSAFPFIAPKSQFNAVFTEGFATSFKRRTIAVDRTTSPPPVPQNIPGAIYEPSETQFYNPSLVSSSNGGNIAVAGLADFGTRLKIVFSGINGTNIFVPPLVFGGPGGSGTSLVLRLTSGGESGAFSAAGTTGGTGGLSQITITGTTGTAVYEVLDSDPFAIESATIPVTVGFTSNPASNLPTPGVSQVNVSFAPTSTVTTASSSAPIPRFADTSTATNAFSINLCATHLLFPFVTNILGFDTGLAISNTSQDPYGTPTQQGICTLNWYGSGAPAATKTPVVAAGTVFTALTSVAAPSFQGYMIADCQFQYAHGFAFISDLGARNLAMGYLALVISDPPRFAGPVTFAGPNSGEQLSQ